MGDGVEYFLERTRGWLIVAHVAGAVIWFQAALYLTGLYSSHVTAQGGSSLEETPFYSGAVAADHLGAVREAGGVEQALLFFTADTVNALLVGAALAALIGFGLRSLNLQRHAVRYVVAVPLASGAADIIENLLLAIALLYPSATAAVGALAGYATGAKFLLFLTAACLALAGVAIGLVVVVLWRLRGKQ